MRRLYASSGSVALHGALLLCLVVGSYLHVEPLAATAVRMPIVLVLPPPPPPPPAARAGAAARAVEHPTPAEDVAKEIPEIAQPQEVPEAVPEPEAIPGGDGAQGGVSGGAPGGIPGGVPGGDPGGAPGGIPGGAPGGDPSGILTGLPAGEPVYLIGDVRPPERTTFVRPQYPETARQARVPGKVVLEIVVGRTGDVEDVRVLRSQALFDQAAIEAVRQWKYQPALQGGRPVRVYLTVVVEFSLR